MIEIRQVTESEQALILPLCELLIDAVHNGASVGFLAPLSMDRATRYWQQVFASLGDGLLLWVAETDGRITGSVQLAPSQKENGRHRAELQKLFVHSEFRGQGISTRLMSAAETAARAAGCTLLVLDTLAGSGAEAVYQHLGWQRAGEIPNYAASPDGELHATVYYFKSRLGYGQQKAIRQNTTMPSRTFGEITPAWITAILTQSGSMVAGQVLHVEQLRDPNPITQNATLVLTYSEDAKGDCPSRLFFKQNPMPAEARFYQDIAPTLINTVAPVCYDAQYDDVNSHVLLGFVGQTHFALPETLPASLVHNEMIVDAVADLHCQFWDDARLRQDIGALARDVPAFSHTIASQHFAAFVDTLGDRLSAKRRGLYERILARYPSYRPSGPKTLVHGDAHWGNFLYPYDPTTHSVYLIDWAVWHVNSGVGDLAYTIALQCYPERRAWMEQPLVRRYHDRLLAYGIQDYPWEQCWEDYRRMVIEQCLWPIVWRHFELSPNVWWFALECGFAAFDDLRCDDFL